MYLHVLIQDNITSQVYSHFSFVTMIYEVD